MILIPKSSVSLCVCFYICRVTVTWIITFPSTFQHYEMDFLNKEKKGFFHKKSRKKWTFFFVSKWPNRLEIIVYRVLGQFKAKKQFSFFSIFLAGLCRKLDFQSTVSFWGKKENVHFFRLFYEKNMVSFVLGQNEGKNKFSFFSSDLRFSMRKYLLPK